MSEYILDSLEALIFETTNQCDLVRRKIIGYLGTNEIVRIKAALKKEWDLRSAKEAEMEWLEEEEYFQEMGDDFVPYDPPEYDMW